MSFLKFEKSELVNLEYALSRDLIRSNRAGSYASSTIIGCNTRKYHGLLVCPLEEMGGDHHVLLSTLDATVVQHDKEFNLGIHKYEGDNYVPKGHKYVRDFEALIGSRLIYRVGGVVLSREILLVSKTEQVLVKYTLLDANSETLLRLSPFLAFRNHHALSKSNLYANTRYREIANGISSRLYEAYPELHMQCSKPAEFVSVPDWYYNIEYLEEQKRGYEYKEDLYVPGYFEIPIKKGESIVFSASTKEVLPAGLKRKFSSEMKDRIPKDSLKNCLLNAAQQFIVRKESGTQIISGFPWFGSHSRDTFMALPGLTLSTGDLLTSLEVIDTMVARMKGGLFPNGKDSGNDSHPSADAPLWFIWALQQYAAYDPGFDIWLKYGKAIKAVLETYRDGTAGIVHMKENGLICAAMDSTPLTWMDAMVDGRPVTPRDGFVVEINALWYNAVCQSLEWAGKKDKIFVGAWGGLKEKISASFIESFWVAKSGYLVDYFNDSVKDLSVRPNQVMAASMHYSPLTQEMKKSILDVIEGELLTERGLRSLSPKNGAYKGVYEGNQVQRDTAFHQGTVWPWLLEHFIIAYLDVYKKSGQHQVNKIYEGFEEVLSNRGIGSISEVYDGNPPHNPKGGVSQATAVAALLRIGEITESFN